MRTRHPPSHSGTKPRTPRLRLRGASLIEMTMAMALLHVVLSIAVGLVAGIIQSGARARALSDLSRQGFFLNHLLGNELRMVGYGVPTSAGNHIDDAYAGAGGTFFDSSVILATATAFGGVADLPRPDAQYSTFGLLDSRPGGSRSNVYWHTENNGHCAPDTVSPSCVTGTSSFFFPGENGCDAVTDVNDRTCPWGMKRVRAGDRIQVVSGAMRWTHAGVSSPMSMSALGASGPLTLNLTTTWNAIWPNLTAADPPVAVSGQGFVTTVDRMFFYLDGTNLKHVQCWGDPDPGSANWPNLATNTLPATFTSTPSGGVQNECTSPEIVAQNVSSVLFQYFDGTGTVTTSKNQVRRVDWTIKLEKTVNGRTVQQVIAGSAALRN